MHKKNRQSNSQGIKYAIGIDLHGTLLDENWTIKKSLIPRVCSYLETLKNDCLLYICTGNNLGFVKKHVDNSVKKLIDGYILETGSVYSDGNTEKVLLKNDEILSIRLLDKLLKSQKFPNILYYADRLATISIFTKKFQVGTSPLKLWEKINEFIIINGFDNIFRVTHSDVAVDIVTKNINKYTGIKKVVGNLPVYAIADCDNDQEFLGKSDFSFIPANSRPEQWKNRMIQMEIYPLKTFDASDVNQINHQTVSIHANNLTKNDNEKKIIYQSPSPYTEGLLDVLQSIVHRNNRQNH